MAQNSEQQGPATDLVKQAAERTSTVASWLEDREPGHVVDEVTRFARQRPGAFLAIAAGAGLLVGRLGRGLKAANDDDGNNGDIGGNSSARGPGSAPNLGAGENPRQGYATTPPPQVPVYPPAPGYPQQAPGFQQPPPDYRQPAPGYQPPPPGYPQGPGYPRPRGIRRGLVTGRRRERVLRRAPGAVRGRRPVDR